MKKILARILIALLALGPQATSAQVTIPYTFTPGTTILSAEVNSNFSTLGTSALNRTGGTITGNISVNSGITIDGADIGAYLVSSGEVRAQTAGSAAAPAFSSTLDTTTGVYFPAAGQVSMALSGVQKWLLNASGLTLAGTNILDSSGKVPGFTSTYFASLDGSAITSIPEANITDGSILARVAANETITGAWTFNIGTITSDIKIAQFLATWNNAGVTFTGLNVDVTNTASAAASKLLDLKVGGSSVFSVDVSGKTSTTTFQMTTGATNGFVLTSDGSGNASWASVPAGTTGVPSGMVAWFESACPGGWTRRSGSGETYENKFVRGGATYSAAGGGADTHTHSVDPPNTTSASAGAHTHTVDIASTASDSQGSHTHTMSGSTGNTTVNHSHTFTTGGPSATTSLDSGGIATSTTSHTHSGTTAGTVEDTTHSHGAGSLATGSAGAHTHTTDPASVTSSSDGAHTHDTNIGSFTSGSGSNVPAYVQVVVCKKD